MRSEFEKAYEPKELSMTRLELQLTLAKLQAATAKLDQLTKQWDAAMAKYYMKNIFSVDAEVDQCHLGDMLDILDGKVVDEIEQALKGD